MYAVIAGSRSGLAQAAIGRLLEAGYTVFEGDLSIKENEVRGNEHLVHLDVTDDSSLEAFRDYVMRFTDRIDILSDFAGLVVLGSFVEMPYNTMDRILSVNFLAVFKLSNLFFPLLEKGHGRIINISSEYARIPAIPIHGYYPLTKHAVDFYTDSLRRELISSPVSVTAIRPGAFRTSMQGGIDASFDALLSETKRYKRFLRLLRPLMDGELRKAKDPSLFASCYMKAASDKRPRRYYNVGNSLKMKLLRFVPSSIQDLAYRILIGK
ncbi:MAG: SDR family NAD(P)-dependent oxidoreductase [Candidatus Ornithospirochaeta sp.]|nr:SDR family NAD(P)-dependent oxidoreductase [Candidatus Ornithospirochaeta sp.]